MFKCSNCGHYNSENTHLIDELDIEENAYYKDLQTGDIFKIIHLSHTYHMGECIIKVKVIKGSSLTSWEKGDVFQINPFMFDRMEKLDKKEVKDE